MPEASAEVVSAPIMHGNAGKSWAGLSKAGLRAVAIILLSILAGKAALAGDIFKTDEERDRFYRSLNIQNGPLRVSIPEASAEVDLPKGMFMVTGKDAQRAYHAMQGVEDTRIVAVLVTEDFIINFTYLPDGYFRMDDWSTFDPDVMMRKLRRDAKYFNEERKRTGMSDLTPAQWEVAPRLNRELALVYWATSFKDEGTEIINIDAYRLSRYGLLGMQFIATKEIFEENPGIIAIFENNLHFKAGARYEDYRAGDKVAEKSIAALLMSSE